MSLIKVTQRLDQPLPAQATLSLPFELRQKSRLRAALDNGEEVGLMLPRGLVLRGGDCLQAENGLVIKLIAAPEPVSTVSAPDIQTLLTACYHLGNRHIPLQITSKWLRYLQDHVLDEMVLTLGLTVIHEMAPFEPVAGAYHHSHQQDSHEHGHSHSHSNVLLTPSSIHGRANKT